MKSIDMISLVLFGIQASLLSIWCPLARCSGGGVGRDIHIVLLLPSLFYFEPNLSSRSSPTSFVSTSMSRITSVMLLSVESIQTDRRP